MIIGSGRPREVVLVVVMEVAEVVVVGKICKKCNY
jgi:hypothetical protein